MVHTSAIFKCQFLIMLDIQEWRALVIMPGEGGRIRVSIFSHTGFKTLVIPGW